MMIRSSIGLVLRSGQRRRIADSLGLLEIIRYRCLSSTGGEKPSLPPSSSSELAPISGDNLPAKLIDFQVASKIEGEESHIAMVELRPGETLRAEAGAMLFMTHGVEMDTNLSGASSAFNRMMTGKFCRCGMLSGTRIFVAHSDTWIFDFPHRSKHVSDRLQIRRQRGNSWDSWAW
jgi:Mitochondrial biogenesis AIM24